MIKVNLLPPEYRKVEGTPVARFVAILAGVFLTAAAMGFWVYIHFGQLAQVRDEHDRVESEVKALKLLAERSEALANEFKEYQKRRDTIEKIGASRVLWSRKLDEVADLIHNDGDTSRHMVWLRNLSASRQGAGMRLRFSGLSGGEEWSRISDFHKDLQEDEDFFKDFVRIDAPAGKRKPLTDGRVPAYAVEFDWSLDMAPKDKKK